MRNATIRVQAFDTGWETVGIDRLSGIVAENVKYSADLNGCTSASFDLKRSGSVMWPDLAAFTPIEIEVDGVLVWSGRVKETPTRESASESVVNVQAEGWQYHLDDDVYSKTFVRTRLSDWQDARSFPTTVLGTFTSDLYVNSENGAITIGGQNGTSWATLKEVGIILDLGPNATAQRLVVKGYRTAGAPASVSIYGRATNDPANMNNVSFISDAFAGVALNTVSTTAPSGTILSGTITTPYRYVAIFLYNSGATYTVAASDNNGDVFIITDIQVFTDPAYESGNASILKASDVVKHSLSALPLLSRDTSGITTTSFSIPDFSVVDPQTPRTVQDAVNAFHNYRRLVDVNRRLIFGPQPSAAIIEASAGSVVAIEDASANSGDDIYNKAVLTGTQANGLPLYVERLTTGAPVTYSDQSASSGAAVSVTLTGTFYAHRTYTVKFSVFRRGSTTAGTAQLGVLGTDTSTLQLDSQASGEQRSYTISWTPKTTVSTGVTLWVSGTNGTTIRDLTVSGISQSGGGTSLPDYRGFFRTKSLPLNFPTTTAAATALGDTFIAGHTKTPFKGSVAAQGSNALLRVKSGEPVPPHLMTLYVGEMLRLPDRVDPDTGALGRDGKMAQIDVELATDTATIALDNTRNNFESFLARLEIVTNRRLGG